MRVLVHLAVPHVPEAHLLGLAHVATQRQHIASAQRLVRDNLRSVVHRVIREFGGAVPMMAMELGPDGLRLLETLRGVTTHVVEERPRRPALAESVPRIQADRAQAIGYDGTGTVIVIMDTGIDKGHPFFEDENGGLRIIHEACFSSNSVGAVSLCPNRLEEDFATGAGAACDASRIDGCDHGTLVAGIAAGRGDDFNGVAPGADLVSIQVFSQINDPGFCGGPALTPCVGSFPSDQLAAGLYVRDRLLAPPLSLNVAAINLSLGSDAFSIPCDGSFPAEANVIVDLRARGVATVAASGNSGLNGLVSAPACVGAAISVGATTDPPTERLASFSNRAPRLSLLAPGGNITTSAPGGGFVPSAGTSMATPHVAGAFAIFRQAAPAATVEQVLDALQDTGLPIGAFRRLRVLDALTRLTEVVPTVQFSAASFGADEGDVSRTVTISLTRSGPPALIAGTTSTVLVSTTGGTATPGTTGAADYVPISKQLVTFAPGATTASVALTVRGDFTIEPDETVSLALAGPTGAVLGPRRAAVLTIRNDDHAGTIAFQQDTYTVDETAGVATITLVRTGGLAAGATARVSTEGTATASANHTPITNKVVSFEGGATTATFTIAIVDDAVAGPDETVPLRITGVGAGASVGTRSLARLVIRNDDLPGTVQFSQATYQVTEGTATVPITVTRSGGAAGGVTVRYRVIPGDPGSASGGGVDYALAGGTLIFGPAEPSRTFTVPVVNDTLVEPSETVRLELVDPSPGLTLGPQRTATLTIHDDAPTFRFAAATYSVTEGTAARLTVERANGLGSAVSVGYQVVGTGTATGAGVDHSLANGTVTFAKGVTRQTITIPTTPDTTSEPSETIVVRLVSPSAGSIVAPDTTTVTIGDNDPAGRIEFSAAAYRVMENAGPAVVRVTRTGSNLGGGVTVQLTTSHGSARAADYASASQMLTFAARETFKDVPVTIVDDRLLEDDETVTLTLSNPTAGATLGAIQTAVLTIHDDEQALEFSAPGYTVHEASRTVSITVRRIGPPVGTVTVDYASVAASATPAADYTHVAGTLTFGPGVTSRSFTVPILANTQFESAEAIGLRLANPTGGALLGLLRAAAITVVDDDPPGTIGFGAPTYAVAEGGVATITVVRTLGTASAVTVDYATVAGGTATAGVDYTTTSGTLAFDVGERLKTFPVSLPKDALDEPGKIVRLALSNPTGGASLGPQRTADLTIADDDLAGPITFSAPRYTVGEAAGRALIRIARGGGAAGVTVDLTVVGESATATADYQNVSQTLVFAAGERAKTIEVPIVSDAVREGNETLRLTLSNPTGGATLGTPREAVLAITDDETGGTVQFGATAYQVTENVAGGQALVTITRTGRRTPGETVVFSTAAGGSASAGAHFTPVSGQVTFVGTEATVTVPIAISNNDDVDGSRTVNLVLSSPSPGLGLGVPRTAVLTILDDDVTIQFSSGTAAVTEGGSATLTLTRTGSTLGSATVDYVTRPGGASAAVDYAVRSGRVTFGPGVTSRTITVPVLDDGVVEGAETFTVLLSNPSPAASVRLGSPSTVAVTIADNDAPGVLQLEAPTYAVTEGGPATLTVTRLGGSAGAVTVHYATSDGGSGAAAESGIDYAGAAGVLTFPSGVTRKTITVPTRADRLLEGPETFTVALTNPGGGATLGVPAAAVVTIVDDETPTFRFAAAGYAVPESRASVSLTVQRLGPTTAQNTVQYALAGVTAAGAGVDFVGASGVLTFAPGVVSRTIVVPIVQDTTHEAVEALTATLSAPTGGAGLGTPRVATVTIADDDSAGAVEFGQLSYAASEGQPATITVVRSGTAGPVSVSVVSSNGTATAPGDYGAVSSTVTFQAGETVKTFEVTTVSDSLAEGSHTVSLTLTDPTNGLLLGVHSTSTLWILDATP